MTDHERRIIQAAANGSLQQPQQPQVNPALHFFFPSYYQIFTAMVAKLDAVPVAPEFDQVADEAYAAAAAAFKRMGFDFVPKWERQGGGFTLSEEK